MSSFGEAINDADEILTLIALMPVAIIVLIMALNFGNPDFNAIAYFERGMTLIAYAMIPSLGAILVLGTLLWISQNFD